MLTVPRLPSAAARTSRRLSMAVPRLPALGTPAHLEAVERRLRALYEGRHGASAYIGEPLTIASHSLLAAQLAHADGAPADVRLAALLHDIGHLLGLEAGRQPGMDGCGTAAHEAVGAAFVAALGFSESVSHLVGAHVDAKRYLCAVEPGYAATLSAASRTTLRHQGGPMSAAEARAAAARPSWPHVLAMRRWDEAAKDPAMRAAPFDAHIPLIRAHLAASAAAATGAQRQAACHAGGYVLSAEQLAQWDEAGALLLRGALPVGVERSLGGMAEQVAGLRGVPGPWLVHLEAPEGRGARRPQLARVERFCDGLPAWATLCHAHAGSLCAQALREHVFLFKDKLNFKGPGGGGFLAHQDASAYATLASRHVSALVAIDAATEENGALQVRGLRRARTAPRARALTRAPSSAAASPDRARRARARPAAQRARRAAARGGARAPLRDGADAAGRRAPLLLVRAAPLGPQPQRGLAALGLPHVQPGGRGRPARGLLCGQGGGRRRGRRRLHIHQRRLRGTRGAGLAGRCGRGGEVTHVQSLAPCRIA